MIEVSAKAPKIEKEATITVDLGENVQDAISRFGEEVVFSNFMANVKIGVQSGIRRMLEAGKTEAEIQTAYDSWKPGVTMERVVDPVAALAAKFSKMSDEEKQAAFAALQAKLGA